MCVPFIPEPQGLIETEQYLDSRDKPESSPSRYKLYESHFLAMRYEDATEYRPVSSSIYGAGTGSKAGEIKQGEFCNFLPPRVPLCSTVEATASSSPDKSYRNRNHIRSTRSWYRTAPATGTVLPCRFAIPPSNVIYGCGGDPWLNNEIVNCYVPASGGGSAHRMRKQLHMEIQRPLIVHIVYILGYRLLVHLPLSPSL